MTSNKYRVIFLGPTGDGKTSVIKTLLRVANPISTTNAIESTTATTTTHQTYTATILGKEMVLVDTPGLRDPSGEAGIESELHGAFRDILPGPHIIVIVFSVKTPPKVIRQTFLRYQERLGHKDVLRHTTVIFTGVDMLESSGSNFNDHISSLPTHIKQLIGTHIVALNNKATAQLINVLQVKELIHIFDQIFTKNFGMHFNVKRLGIDYYGSDVATTDIANIFEKNSEDLEKKLLLDNSQNERDGSNTGVTVVTIEQTPGEHIQNGTSSASDGSTDGTNPRTGLTQQNNHETDTIQAHENVRLHSLPPSETVSRVSDDASMVTSTSSMQEKDGQMCCCFGGIARRFRSTPTDPEFKQFN